MITTPERVQVPVLTGLIHEATAKMLEQLQSSASKKKILINSEYGCVDIGIEACKRGTRVEEAEILTAF